ASSLGVAQWRSCCLEGGPQTPCRDDGLGAGRSRVEGALDGNYEGARIGCGGDESSRNRSSKHTYDRHFL
ncbi:unnamed protein product, partial [Pylaiella littoralis]